MAGQPLRSPTFEVGCFMQLHGKSLLPNAAIASPAAGFERRLSVQTHSKETALIRQQRFIKKIEDFCKEFSEEFNDPELANFDIRKQKGGWSTVFHTSDTAVEQYKSKRRGVLGFLRNSDVLIGRSAATIEPFLQLLPCGEYTSIVCGGVKLIFAAFKRKADSEQVVMETLGEAPQQLERAEMLLTIYHQDAELQQLIDELFMALLAAIEAMVKWLTRKMDRFRTMFSTAGLDTVTNAVRQCHQKVELRADQCQKFNAAENEALTRQVHINVLRAAMRQEENGDMIRQLADSNAELRALFIDAKKNEIEDLESIRAAQTLTANQMDHTQQALDDMRSHLKKVEERSEAVNRNLEASLSAAQQHNDQKEKLIEYFLQKSRQDEERRRTLEQQIAWQGQQQQTSHIFIMTEVVGAGQMIQWLGTSSASSTLDATMSLRETPALNLGNKLSQVVTQSPQLLQWLSPDCSSIIFIEPVGSIAHYPTASPGTVVTASMAQVIGKQNYALVLKHFCAQHQYKTRGIDRISDIFASLVVQLLDLYPFDLTSWSTDSPYGYSILLHRQLSEERDLSYLCRLFEYLVTSLHYHTAFVLLDDFYLLERSAEDESLDKMFSTFGEIMSVTPALKVLCMTPEETDGHGRISGRVRDNDKLRVDLEEVERGRNGILRSRPRIPQAPLADFVDLD